MTHVNSSQPAMQNQRRSPLYRRHTELKAEFESLGDASLVSRYGELAAEIESAAQLGLADLSALPRIGFKGAGAPQWAISQGIKLPESPNHSVVQDDGALVGKLSHQELLILSDLAGSSALVNSLEPVQIESLKQSEPAAQTYHLPRAHSHSCLAVTGTAAAEMFSKVCGVDLRSHKFAQGQIAQTSLAKINAVIVRHDLAETPCFYVLSDISTVEFLWDCLLDAMQEYAGVPVGVAALRSLAARG
ncbi:MAG: sarcosine oxidase [Porticoccaceae bacterium]|jgi:sarcosine oxidase, subunit gamma|nr:sarcosine oxidase [Porticoccaceae bacterium]MBT5577585.1 sarcosine oxidase [Porticoccaceae bacterium]MBT7375233.1 sarcosine oxidase [Porticoccaceae bacterium]